MGYSFFFDCITCFLRKDNAILTTLFFTNQINITNCKKMVIYPCRN